MSKIREIVVTVKPAPPQPKKTSNASQIKKAFWAKKKIKIDIITNGEKQENIFASKLVNNFFIIFVFLFKKMFL